MSGYSSPSPTLISSPIPMNPKKMKIPLESSRTGRSRTAYDQELHDLERSHPRPSGLNDEHRAWRYKANGYFPQEPPPTPKVEKLYRTCCCDTRRGMAAWIIGILIFVILIVMLIVKVAIPANNSNNSVRLNNVTISAESGPTALALPTVSSTDRDTTTVTISPTLSDNDKPTTSAEDNTETTSLTTTNTDTTTVSVTVTSVVSGGTVTSLITATTTASTIATTTQVSTVTTTVTTNRHGNDNDDDTDDSDSETTTATVTTTDTIPTVIGLPDASDFVFVTGTTTMTITRSHSLWTLSTIQPRVQSFSPPIQSVSPQSLTSSSPSSSLSSSTPPQVSCPVSTNDHWPNCSACPNWGPNPDRCTASETIAACLCPDPCGHVKCNYF